MECPALPLQRLVARRTNLSPKSARRHLPAVYSVGSVPACCWPSPVAPLLLEQIRLIWPSPGSPLQHDALRQVTSQNHCIFHLQLGKHCHKLLATRQISSALTQSPAGIEEGCKPHASGPCNRWHAPQRWLDNRDKDHNRMGGNRTRSCCLETRLSRCK